MTTKKKPSKVDRKAIKKDQPAKKTASKKSLRKKAAPKKAAAKSKESKSTKSSAGAKAAPEKSSFSLGQVIQRQTEVPWRLIEGEAVLITPVDSTMHSLNDTGTCIWEAIDGQRTLKQVAKIVADEFAVNRDRAEKDTLWFVECLSRKGLVDKV